MEKLFNGVYRLRFGTPEEHTPETLRRIAPKADGLSRKADTPCPFTDADAQFAVTPRGALISLPFSDGEGLYGFGLQLRSYLQNGRKKTLRTNADPVGDSGDSHAPVPFYISTAGYGVLVDSCRYVSFYCGSSAPRPENGRSVSGGIGAQASEAALYASRDASRCVTIEIPYASGADIYIFAGENMLDAAAKYALYSGGGAMPPMHGMGMLYRGYGQGDQALQERIISEIRRDHIPCTVYGLEPGWHTHAYSCTYEWNEANYPDHSAFINKAEEQNFRVNLWEHAYVHPDARDYDKIAPYSGDYLVWDGLVPDFTTDGGRETFLARQRELADEGIDGFKLDECDSSDFTGGWAFPNHARFPGGLDGEQYHNQFGIQFQSALDSVYRERDKRAWHMVRASHSYAAPYPFVLYSDLYNHDDFLRGLVNASFTGLLWTPEVRTAVDAEDFMRRLALTILSPMPCINAWFLPNPPWLQFDREKNVAGELLPDAERKSLTDMTRKLLQLRMSLTPYLYAAFRRYHDEGVHPFRALVLEYPTQPQFRETVDQFMVGDSIMAAPLASGHGDGRSVAFPCGDAWYDLYTGERHEGGSLIELASVPMDIIPMYVREGSLIPFAKPVEYIAPDTVFELTLRSYGDGGSFELYEDDGETFAFERGECAVSRVNAATPSGWRSPMGRYSVV